jgi:hypothetical protein
MPEPFLHLCYIRLMVKRIRGGCSSQGMNPQAFNIANANFPRVMPNQPIHPVRGHRLIEFTVDGVAYQPEEGRGGVISVPQHLNILGYHLRCSRMKRKVLRLAALAMHAHVQHPSSLRYIPHFERAEFLAAEPMIEL